MATPCLGKARAIRYIPNRNWGMPLLSLLRFAPKMNAANNRNIYSTKNPCSFIYEQGFLSY
jgi:hypothetical protein